MAEMLGPSSGSGDMRSWWPSFTLKIVLDSLEAAGDVSAGSMKQTGNVYFGKIAGNFEEASATIAFRVTSVPGSLSQSHASQTVEKPPKPNLWMTL